MFAFLITSLGSSLVFTLMIVLNWNLRLKDKGLLLPQLACPLATQLIFLALAPQLSVIFLASIPVFFNFPKMSFNPQYWQYMAAWLFVGAASLSKPPNLYGSKKRQATPLYRRLMQINDMGHPTLASISGDETVIQHFCLARIFRVDWAAAVDTERMFSGSGTLGGG